MAELRHWIKEVVFLQPVVVRRPEMRLRELIMGERRWRASKLAERTTTIPAIVRQTDDNDMLRDAPGKSAPKPTEPLKRRTPISNCWMTSDAPTRVGKPDWAQSTSDQQYLRLMKLSAPTQKWVMARGTVRPCPGPIGQFRSRGTRSSGAASSGRGHLGAGA
ncbi:MAG: ParB N-terminal domain-containing protein [Marmoricola sp.]